MAPEKSDDSAKSTSRMNSGAIQGTNSAKLTFFDQDEYSVIWNALNNPDQHITDEVKRQIKWMGCPHLNELLKARLKTKA